MTREVRYRLQRQGRAATHRRVPETFRRLFVVLTATTLAALVAVPTDTALPASATASPQAQVIPVPATIVNDCSADVADSLRKWLYSLPTGTATTPILVQFAKNGCYQLDSSIFLHNFTDYIFDGNGSTFKEPTTNILVTSQTGQTQSYCGSTTEFGPNPGHTAYANRPDIMWWFDGGCDITIENMTIQGPNSGGGPTSGGGSAVDSAIQLSGVQRVDVNHTTIEQVDGDFVTIGGLIDATPQQGNQQTYPSISVTVSANTFSTSGRQGVSDTTGGNRISITNNSLTGVNDSIFDLESDTVGGCECDVNISNNTISGGYGYLLAALTGAAVNNLALVNNSLVNGAKVKIQTNPGLNSSNWTIANNTAAAGSTWPWPSIMIDSGPHGSGSSTVDNVDIGNNSVPYPTVQQPYALAGANATDVAVRNNYMSSTSMNGVMPLSNEGNSSNYSCGNTITPNGSPVDGTCGSYSPPQLPAPPILPADYPDVTIASPAAGAVLSGTTGLDVVPSDQLKVTAVQLYLSGGGLNGVPIGAAQLTEFGWVLSWNTTTVSNGVYSLEAVAANSAGDDSGATVSVTVQN